MKLRQLKIRNFRGIRELDWAIKQDMVCLVGPGNWTKSTILEGIDYVLWPSAPLSVSDLDFYQRRIETPIEITAVVTNLPLHLIREDKFGLLLGFWNASDGLHPDDGPGDEKALVIKLSIQKDLEPEWFVKSPQEGGRQQRISATDRRLLGGSRIGTYTERDLAWGRSSALSRMTSREDIAGIPGSWPRQSATSSMPFRSLICACSPKCCKISMMQPNPWA